MHGLVCEEYQIKDGSSAKFIARHLSMRMRYGKAVIIARNPHATISAVRKQWLKLIRTKQKERASTLDAGRIRRLVEVTAYMRGLRFTIHYPPEEYVGDVYVASPDAALQWPPSCQTLYVSSDLKREELYMVTAWMPKNTLAVILRYENDE